MISVSSGASIREVNIWNQVGKNVFKGIPDRNTIDISDFQPGIYIIEVICDQQRLRKKLIVE
jgi:hypothetical protein